MDFRVLGTLEVWRDGTRVALPSPRHQRVLAGLLMAPDSVVPVPRLVDVLWPENPPATATKQVQNCISALRERFGDTANQLIVTDGPGYRVTVADDQLDALRFRRGIDTAARLAADGRLVDAVAEVRSALTLWRGPALDGLGAAALAGRAARLDEQRLAAIEQCVDWQLALGQHREVIDELAELAVEHPLRERTHARLMTALAAEGRQAEALKVFHGLRVRLADELGIDPGAEIVELHERILRGHDARQAIGDAVQNERRPTDARRQGLERAKRELAEAITRQWEAEAETRSLNRPRPVSLRWSSTRRPVAVQSTRSTFRGDLDDLVVKFRQIPTGQLVVLGEAGAGKSVIAILLTLGLLADLRPGDPVPVLLPLASWDAHTEHLHTWLARKLREDYPGLANAATYGPDAATRLVLEGHVLPVLDGLDETPPDLHAAAIDALDQAVAGDRPLVTTCRADEYERAVSQAGAILASAAVVEVEPVALEAAVMFLIGRERVGEKRWQAVVEHLRRNPDGALAHALRTPLMVDLARTAYTDPTADPTELCDTARFPDRAAIEEHLLDTYLPTVYAQRPEPPAHRTPAVRYDPAQAQQWLTFLARHLAHRNTRELAWWQLDSTIPPVLRSVVLGFLPALFFAATGWVANGPRIALIYGLSFGIGGAVAHALGKRSVPLGVELRFRASAPRFAARFVVGAMIGAALGLAWTLSTAAIGVLAVVFGLSIGTYAWLDKPVEVNRVSNPRRVLRRDRLAGISFAITSTVSLGLFYGLAYAFTSQQRFIVVLDGTFDLVTALAAGLAGGVLGRFLLGQWGSIGYGVACIAVGGQVFGLSHHALTAPSVGVLFGLGVGLAIFLSRAWGTFVVSRLWLALRGHTPLRLMRFLDDAHRRGVLRQVGAVYQFRHARLQDRLAAEREIGAAGSGPA